MNAMLFAAGMGTRLKPLTDTMPKALVQIGGKPLIDIALHRLKKAGAERVVVNVHHFADKIIGFLETKRSFGIRIEVEQGRKSPF